MSNGLQDLAGEVARLRHECNYFLRVLDELESRSRNRVWLSEAQSADVVRTNKTYSWSAKDNLGRATDDLRNWSRVLSEVMTETTTRLAY